MNREYFEQIAAEFTAKVAVSISAQLKSSIFASPLSARTPDLCMLWHPVYRNKNRSRLLANLLISLFVSCLKGLVRLVCNFKPFGFLISGHIKSTLLVVTSTCAHQTKRGNFKTDYVSTGEDDALFVFGPVSFLGTKVTRITKLPFKTKFLFSLDLSKNGLSAFFSINGNFFDKLLLLLKWLSWVCAAEWLYFFYLDSSLSQILRKYKIRKIGCIHEMHAYSRTVWMVADRYEAERHTVQHASISKGKRWYFPYPAEIAAGLVLPNVMYIYNDSVRQLLDPYYKNTKFILGCSSRYSHWKGVKKSKEKGTFYLFVGALAGFDNSALILSVDTFLARSVRRMPVRLRLHPVAQLSPWMRAWIKNKLRDHEIELSNDTSLKKDLDCASIVIGMSTTVLEEALLLGRPVIQLTHPDYLQFIDLDGTNGVTNRNYKDISGIDLFDIESHEVEPDGMRGKLGLNHPEVTYKVLFGYGC